jgi:hypothetical protein
MNQSNASPTNFTDAEGDQWAVTLTAKRITAVKVEFGLDLARLMNTNLAGRVIPENSERLVGMLWVMCEEQAASRGVTPEAFGKRLCQERVFEAAGLVLFAALAAFFPNTVAARAFLAMRRRK